LAHEGFDFLEFAALFESIVGDVISCCSSIIEEHSTAKRENMQPKLDVSGSKASGANTESSQRLAITDIDIERAREPLLKKISEITMDLKLKVCGRSIFSDLSERTGRGTRYRN